MTKRIYSNVTTSISELKKNPIAMTHHDIVCVLSRCNPAFYCVDPVRMAQLIEAEEELADIKLIESGEKQKRIRVNLEEL